MEQKAIRYGPWDPQPCIILKYTEIKLLTEY
jgi:hypothetical protein